MTIVYAAETIHLYESALTEALRILKEIVLGYHSKDCNLSQTFGFCVGSCPDRNARELLSRFDESKKEK